MSWILGDLPDEAEPFFEEDTVCLCERCHEVPMVDGYDYCAACQVLEDAEELRDIPILQPITVRPVELNHDLWAEAKRIVAKMDEMPQDLRCDDCEQVTTWKYAVQEDPWFRPTGETLCENCAEKRWYRHQEKLMETT